MKVQIPVGTTNTDEELAFIREMGVETVNLNVSLAESGYEALMRAKERLAKFHLEVGDVTCAVLQKNPAIDLGWKERDKEIDRFIASIEAAGKAEIPIVSVAWQPNGILRSGWKVGEHTRGGVAMYADMAEISARPNANDRAYTAEEIWANFSYFLERTIPVCEQCHVRMALHPNDPPVPMLAGVPSLIACTGDYRRAFALAHESPALGMKLCVGCWLEGGAAFGNLMEDIKEFAGKGQILCVHFRNVSAPMPYFEEVLAEDGYADLYPVMKQLVACGYDGLISVDHAFRGYPSMGGVTGSFAYPTGYLKGLWHAARSELSHAASGQ